MIFESEDERNFRGKHINHSKIRVGFKKKKHGLKLNIQKNSTLLGHNFLAYTLEMAIYPNLLDILTHNNNLTCNI